MSTDFPPIPPDDAREALPNLQRARGDEQDGAQTVGAADALRPVGDLTTPHTRPLEARPDEPDQSDYADNQPRDARWRDEPVDASSEEQAVQPHPAIQFAFDTASSAPRLIVVGIGGAGCNIVNYMIESGMAGVEFMAINADTQALGASRAHHRIVIGEHLTRGMGTGGDPAIGQQAAQESYPELVEALDGADMVFITAGMGGGAGTGASPIVAQAAREAGALTLAIVTTPFAFERRRRVVAEQGVAALRSVVDALITVPNERLAQIVGRDTSLFEAYRQADEAMRVGVQGVSELITIPGLINVDFADLRSVMSGAGSAYLATGSASGENRAEQALRAALSNPLLDIDITGARGLIFNVTGGDNLSMREVEQIANALSAAIHPDANLIFGATYDASAGDTLKVTVVATGFEPHVAPEARPSTWTPGRISMAPESAPSRPQPPLPGRMRFDDEPLPSLADSPTSNYQPGSRRPWQEEGAARATADQRADVVVGPGAPPSRPSSQPPSGAPINLNPPSQPPTRATAREPAAPQPAAPQPSYPREQYAENTEEFAREPEHEERQGFWGRLFSSNPPPHAPPPHAPRP